MNSEQEVQTAEYIRVRCSALPRILCCPASYRYSHRTLSSDVAELGSCMHEIAARYCFDGSLEIHYAAQKYGVNEDEVNKLTEKFLEVYKEVVKQVAKSNSTIVKIEQSLSAKIGDIELYGTPDITYLDHNTRVIVDWKFGYKEKFFREQLLGYAFLALGKYADANVDKVRLVTAYIRSGEFDVVEFNKSDIDYWASHLQTTLTFDKDEYHAGNHCEYCQHRNECPTLSESNQMTVRLLYNSFSPDVEEKELSDNTARILLQLKPRVAEVLKMIDKYNDLLKSCIRDLGEVNYDGRTWYVSTETRKNKAREASESTFEIIRNKKIDDNSVAETKGE